MTGAKRSLIWSVAALCVGVFGCGTNPVLPRGEVEGTLRSKGKPLGNVVVTFVPFEDALAKRCSARGVTDAYGRYRLQSEDQQPGVSVGKYRVTLEDLAIYTAPRDVDGTVLQSPPVRFASQLSDPMRSNISKQVESGLQTIDLEL